MQRGDEWHAEPADWRRRSSTDRKPWIDCLLKRRLTQQYAKRSNPAQASIALVISLLAMQTDPARSSHWRREPPGLALIKENEMKRPRSTPRKPPMTKYGAALLAMTLVSQVH